MNQSINFSALFSKTSIVYSVSMAKLIIYGLWFSSVSSANSCLVWTDNNNGTNILTYVYLCTKWTKVNSPFESFVDILLFPHLSI